MLMTKTMCELLPLSPQSTTLTHIFTIMIPFINIIININIINNNIIDIIKSMGVLLPLSPQSTSSPTHSKGQKPEQVQLNSAEKC